MRTLLVGLSALTFTMIAGAALAQSSTAPDSSAAPMAAMPGKPSVKTTMISDLLANPATKAVVEKDLPGLTADPRLQQAMSMTLTDIEAYSEGKITDAVLAKVQADFDAIPGQ
jgi:Spy/CpxP family protein refolding chaperone